MNNAADNGNYRARLALKILGNSVKKLIGAYVAEMNGLDALVFTAGIGENDFVVRRLVCEDMDYLGIAIDEDKNLGPSRAKRARFRRRARGCAPL